MDDPAYYQIFENHLKEELIKMCTASGFLAGKLLNSDDIDLKWNDIVPNYLADAMPQITAYPTVAVAWAAYVGMAVAKWWDQDWETFSNWPYDKLHGKRGFDDMDEHIVRDILGIKLDSEDAAKIEEIIRQCATTAITFIRHEDVEPQTQQAFYLFARAVKVMYEIGAAIELKRIGYKWNKAF